MIVSKESWINPKIEIRTSKLGGKGMFALTQISRGEKILMWGGQYLRKEETRTAEQEGKLLMQWDDDLFSVEDRGEENAYFINHSCEPNVWMDDAVTLIAMRDVSTGEELTADYAMWEAREDYVSKWECNCGAKNCRGKVRGTDWRQTELQNKYAGHFSPLISKRLLIQGLPLNNFDKWGFVR